MDISGKLAQANGRLRSGRVGVTIEQFGGKLRLRATLPPKPGSKKEQPFQQRITVGLPANPVGLREAEKEARLIGAQLAANEFTWERYHKTPEKEEAQPLCAEWIASLPGQRGAGIHLERRLRQGIETPAKRSPDDNRPA